MIACGRIRGGVVGGHRGRVIRAPRRATGPAATRHGGVDEARSPANVLLRRPHGGTICASGDTYGIVRTRSGVELITKGMCSTGPKAFVLQAPLARCSGVLDDTSQGACVSRNRPSELWSPPRGSVDPARERGRGRRDLGAHSVTSIERPRLGVPVQGNREGFACPAPLAAPLAAPPSAPLAACAACRLASMRVP